MAVILNRYSKALYCDLSHPEMLQAVKELGETINALELEQSKQDSARKAMKSRLSDLESRRMELCGKITRAREEREVPVELHADYPNGIAIEIRMDTYEVMSSRPLTEEEKQLGLPVASELEFPPIALVGGPGEPEPGSPA